MTTPMERTALVLEGVGCAPRTPAPSSSDSWTWAGNSHTCPASRLGQHTPVNYISRDHWRTRQCFTDFADPRFGNLGTWIIGRGFFHAEYIYQRTGRPNQALPFDFQTFSEPTQQSRIDATRTDNGQQTWFTGDEMTTMDDLMVRVRACSTMPGFMPPMTIDGVEYVDGAIGDASGIPIDAAREMLRDLEADGKAYVFYPRVMPVTNKEKDVTRLRQAYALGMAQVNAELPKWQDFLGV